MLWVLKSTVSLRQLFEHSKHMVKLMDKKIIAILRKVVFLNWPYESTFDDKLYGNKCNIMPFLLIFIFCIITGPMAIASLYKVDALLLSASSSLCPCDHYIQKCFFMKNWLNHIFPV